MGEKNLGGGADVFHTKTIAIGGRGLCERVEWVCEFKGGMVAWVKIGETWKELARIKMELIWVVVLVIYKGT